MRSLEYPIKDWNHFVGMANNFDVGSSVNRPYAYRGQSNSKWTLMPSFLRHFVDRDASPESIIGLEKVALKMFESQAHQYLSSSVIASTTSIIGWWSLMQHYNAPTRMLDWTSSIYVAAYFAVSEHLKEDGVIWIVHLDSLQEQMKRDHGKSGLPAEHEFEKHFFDPHSPHIIAFGERRTQTDRMFSQQGFFSVCYNILGDYEMIFSKLTNINTNIVCYLKIIIPKDLKVVFLRKLQAMNITAASLFPGMDGLGRAVNELVRLGSTELLSKS